MKKIPQTDAIFENVFRENQASDDNPKPLRLSLDTKAKVKIDNLSRGVDESLPLKGTKIRRLKEKREKGD